MRAGWFAAIGLLACAGCEVILGIDGPGGANRRADAAIDGDARDAIEDVAMESSSPTAAGATGGGAAGRGGTGAAGRGSAGSGGRATADGGAGGMQAKGGAPGTGASSGGATGAGGATPTGGSSGADGRGGRGGSMGSGHSAGAGGVAGGSAAGAGGSVPGGTSVGGAAGSAGSGGAGGGAAGGHSGGSPSGQAGTEGQGTGGRMSVDGGGGGPSPGAGGSGPGPGGQGGRGGGAGGRGGAPTPATCDPTSPNFGMPYPVPGLNRIDGHEQGLQLSPDELTAYLSAGTNGLDTYDLYRARRSGLTERFGPYEAITELNSLQSEMAPTVTADGLTIFFDRGQFNSFRMFVASRPDIASPFSAPHPFPTSVADDQPFAGYVLPDGRALYFHAPSIYRQGLMGTSPAGPAEPVKSDDPDWSVATYPVVSADELVIYYTVFDNQISGRLRVRMATRPNPNAKFGAPIDLAAVNGNDDNFAAWISPDACRLYLIRAKGASGSYHYVAERSH